VEIIITLALVTGGYSLAVTYIVVVFSILVQGLTIEKLVRRLSLRE